MMKPYTQYSDFELMDLLQTGDAAALTEIHSRYYGPLYTHAYSRFPFREEVRDILQELFNYLWDNREDIKLNTGLPAYLYGAVRNRLLKVYRHQKVRSDYVASLKNYIDQGEDSTNEQIHEKELLQIIQKEIKDLSPQMRLIFELSRNQELSHKEIAEKLNISPHTVRTQVRNALRILRLKLGANIFLLFF